jgi:syntaxin 16
VIELTRLELRALGGLSSPTAGTSTPVPNPFADDEQTSMLESETDRHLSQSTLQQTAQKRLYNENDTAIAQREREIEDIAQGIIELANIFQELQTMIIDQGTLLDRIDYNVESMGSDVKAAAEELTVASGYQRRSLKRKIMLLLIIVIVGMFILLGLKLSSKSSPTVAPPVQPAPPVNEAPAAEPLASNLLRRLHGDSSRMRRAYSPRLTKRDWRRRKRRVDEIM